VLVGCDPSDRGRDALLLGELLARTSGAGLLVARVQDGSGPGQRGAERALREEVEGVLPDPPGGLETALPSSRSPAHTLLGLIEADPEVVALVLGSTHRAGIGRVMPGSVADRLIGEIRCPVAIAPRGYARARLTLRERGEPGPDVADLPLVRDELRVIAVGFDGSAEGEQAISAAAEIGGLAGAALRLITVGPREPLHQPSLETGAMLDSRAESARLQEALHGAAAELPADLRVQPSYLRGDPVAELLQSAGAGVDLLVLGSTHRGAVRRVWLGSVSSQVIRAAPCSVLVVPRPGAQAGS
jgi:nucleotide-binding universal stress UspA family protein